VVFASQASTISLNRFSCLREIVSQSIQLPSVEALIFFLDLVLTLLFTTICPWYWYQVGERERGSSPHFHGNQEPYRYTERELHLDFDIPHPCSICCFIFSCSYQIETRGKVNLLYSNSSRIIKSICSNVFTPYWDKSLKLFTLNTGNKGTDVKVRETKGITINSNNCPQVSHQCAHGGQFIEVVIGGSNNIRNALFIHPNPLPYRHESLQSFEIYKYFCAQ
jgi:hypothetical protein